MVLYYGHNTLEVEFSMDFGCSVRQLVLVVQNLLVIPAKWPTTYPAHYVPTDPIDGMS
jgi:hypothetical protein